MKWYLSLLIAAFPLAAHAEEQSFDGQISLRAPKRSAWTIRLVPSKAMRVEKSEKTKNAYIDSAALSEASESPALSFMRVEKSDALYSEVAHYKDGNKMEKWIFGKLQLFQKNGADNLSMPAADLLDDNYSDYSKEDFQGLEWLDKKYFTGTITYKGKPCYLFEVMSDKAPISRRQKALDIVLKRMSTYQIQDPSEKQESKPKPYIPPAIPVVKMVAIISKDTRLPVLYNDGYMVRTYDYELGNLPRLVPPEKFAKEFTLWRNYQKKLNAKISSP